MIGLLFGFRGSAGETFAGLNSPFARSAFFWAVVGLAAGTVAFVGGIALLSWVTTWWMIVLLTGALAVAVYVRSRRANRRQMWIALNCCAECGYDLDELPTRTCPECGRDANLDEPTWRRLRREHEAKYGRPVATPAAAAPIDEAEVRRLLARAQQSLGEL
jgi:hypothetical protein